MNSFFATCEQQLDPRLRDKPIAVGGRPGTRSIIAAASIEAKRLGVKTPMSTAEAMSICPSLILVPGQHHRYREISEQITKQIIKKTPDVEVFSVDECFADITAAVGYRAGRLASFEDKLQAAADIICEIKRDIRLNVGDYLSCSVGLASNKFLAKLASDKFKPDGLHVIVPCDWHCEDGWQLAFRVSGELRTRLKAQTVDELILSSELDDFCGLGPRLKIHLNRLGVKTTAELRRANPVLLRQILGVVGEQLWHYAWGRDDRSVAVHYEQEPEKSLSHAITLPATMWRPDEASRFLHHLTAKLGRRMRKQGLAARRVVTFVRFTDFTGRGIHQTRSFHIQDDQTLYAVAKDNFAQLKTFKPIRLIGVGVSLLARADQLTLPLLPEDQRLDRLSCAQDTVNDRFGERVITRASIMTVQHKQIEATHAFGWRFKEGALEDD